MFKKHCQTVASQTNIGKNFYVVSYWKTDGGKGVSFVPCPISERQNALGQDCHQAYEVDTKETLFTKYVSLYIRNSIR